MTEKKKSQWKPGQTGNPKGRPPGQSEITRLRASLAGDVPEILAGLVMAAKGGDVQAARLILERILPPVKAIEQAVALQLPEGGYSDRQSIRRAVCRRCWRPCTRTGRATDSRIGYAGENP